MYRESLPITLNAVQAIDFWHNVDKSGQCWPWQGSTTGGYGVFRHNNKNIRSHRVAYEIVNGRIPPGMFVRHYCDNHLCCNPEHLYCGYTSENRDGKTYKLPGESLESSDLKSHLRRGRTKTSDQTLESSDRKSRRRRHRKLVPSEVTDIRERFARGELQASIARVYGVTPACIANILKGRSWVLPSKPGD